MTLTEDRSEPETATTSNSARHAMIVSQLRTSGVNEPWVLAAMATVAREPFAPEGLRSVAYNDRAIPLDNGRFLAAPLFYGRALAEAEPREGDKVLLVGDANGYFAALLNTLVPAVDFVSFEDAANAGSGDYSLILVDGAIEVLPDALADRLAEGGRIVTGEVLRGVTRLAFGRKAAGKVALMPIGEMGIPVLPEFAAPKRWSF